MEFEMKFEMQTIRLQIKMHKSVTQVTIDIAL